LWVKWNHSIISLIEAPTSKLSNTTEIGVRVYRKTHAPLRLPGTLSTAGQCHRASGLNLVVAAIVLWNTVYLERTVTAIRQTGQLSLFPSMLSIELFSEGIKARVEERLKFVDPAQDLA
jgi:hypothetical protein